MHLSRREREIAELIAQAKTNKEIACSLHLSVGTVKEYLFRVYRKEGVQNRTELALRVHEERRVQPITWP